MKLALALLMLLVLTTTADALLRCKDARTGQWGYYDKKYPGLVECHEVK